MKKLAIAMALASTAMASPALATDGAWYVGVEGGPMIVEDIDLDIGSVNNVGSVDHEYGYDFDGIIGYDFGAFRAEAEVGYRRAQAESIIVGAPGIDQGNVVVGRNFTGTTDINGHSSALSFMINGMFDFGEDDGLQGFVGGGAGVARVDTRYTFANDFLDDSDTRFAWQVIAGVRTPLTENIDVGLKYRFFNVPNVKLSDNLGRDVETRFRSHSILGSVIYNFGRPVPPPPPVLETPAYIPPPPAQLPPPQVVCTPGPYIVFFDWDRSDITPDSAATLDNAVSAYNSGCNGTQVMLAGHTDTSGSKEYNIGLSQRRNDSVRGYLTSRGLNDGSISSTAYGESRLRVETLDGVRNDQNRRVEITYGPGSGL